MPAFESERNPLAESEQALAADLLAGRLSRRELLKRATALGIGSSLVLGGFDAWAATDAREQLTIALPATPAGWDPDQDFGPVSEDMIQAVNGRLVEFKDLPYQGGFIADASHIDYQKRLAPSLATGWKIKGNTITFQLRKGVMSHAGNEITSEDVRWSYERAFGLKAINQFLNGVGGLKSMSDVKVLGKYAISFTTHQPIDIFFMSAALSHRAVFDSAEFKKHGSKDDPYAAKWGRTGDAGFGRWKVVSVEPGNQVIIESFDGHFLGPTPVKRLVLKEVPSSSDRLALLSRSAVDLAYLLAPREYGSLRGKEGVRVWNFPSINIALYQLNPNFPPLDKIEVRQALAYAAPYNDITNSVYVGFATRAGGPIPSIFPGSGKLFSQRYSTNFEKAKALLEKAGATGFSTTIMYDAENPVQEQMAILFQTNLDKIGVKATLKGLTHAAYTAEQVSRKTSDKFPIVTYIDGPFVPHPYYGLYLNFLSTSPNNWSQVKVTGLDALLAKMIKTPSFPQVVKQGLVAQQQIADQVPWIFVAEPGLQIASRDYVKNVSAIIAYNNYARYKA